MISSRPLGEDLFMRTAWACAFEDFLTREFDGENVIDDYLKRRGWKESASVRTYMAALRHSMMSLHEVGDIVRGTSFQARDLIRGGDPVLISEHSATQDLKPWDRIAARIVRVGSQTRIGGGTLVFDQRTSENLIEAIQKLASLSREEEQELAEANGYELDDEAFSDLSPTEKLRAVTPIFTTFWLVDAIGRIQSPKIPDLRNAEGDTLMLCEARFPLAARTTQKDIRAVLQARPEFRPTGKTSWSWVSAEKDKTKPAATPSKPGDPSRESLSVAPGATAECSVRSFLNSEENTFRLMSRSSTAA